MKRRTLCRAAALLLALTGLLTGCSGEAALLESDSAPQTQADPATVTDRLNVWCFQAGKADAFLFWNDSGAVLLDTGESGFGKVILAKLQELGIDRLDYLIITHFDKDHVGGAKKLLKSIEVGTVLQSNSPKTGASTYENYLAALQELDLEPVTVREELSFTLGSAVFTVNPPAQETYAEDPSNNSSLILTVTHGANRMLFLGDAEDARLAEFLETDPGACALVKLPHHGAWQETLRDLLKQTKPAYAVITSSDEEPEDEETLDLLAQCGVETFLTRNGPIQIVSDGLTLTLDPQ